MIRILFITGLFIFSFKPILNAQWVQVATGRQHSAGIKSDGTLWTWGRNNYGQLGTGNYNNSSLPVQIGSGSWVSVACGFDHTVALKSDGTVWAWGRNGYGQIGNGSTSTTTTPVLVNGGGAWASISAKGYASAGIRSDGTLWEWGSVPLSGGGTITIKEPLELDDATNWLSVSLGYTHALALKSNGQLWAWGENLDGELGLGNTSGSDYPVQVGTQTNWTKIAAGDAHNLAVKSDGTLWTWGDNYYGQLGLGNNTDMLLPTQVGSSTNWAAVFAGYDHSLAINNSGALWTWGSDDSGMLGNGTAGSSKVPVQVAAQCKQASGGQYHSAMINLAGDFCCAGNNAFGQTGNGGTANVDQFACGIAPPSCGNGLAAVLPGLWKGTLEQQNNGSFYFEMNLQYNAAANTVSGTSYITVAGNSNYYAVLKLSGAATGNCTFTFTETDILQENAVPGTYWCTKTGSLTISESGTGFNLDGPWTAPTCDPGQIHLGKSVQIPPTLSASATSIQAGQAVVLNGAKFTPSGQAQLQVSGPQGYSFGTTLLTNSSGGFMYSFNFGQNFNPGIYTFKATDLINNLQVSRQVMVFSNPNAANPIQITAPVAGAQFYQVTGNKILVAWTDSYAAFPGLGQYHYKVEYRKTTAGSWKVAAPDFSGPILSSLVNVQYELDLTGEAINASGETFQVRITDLQHSARTALSPDFKVIALVGSASIQLLWDFSFPAPASKPVGVTADSVSRIYLKISGLNNVQKITLALRDGEAGASASTPKQLGKVMPATQLAAYSAEADAANAVSATNNNAGAAQYVFWYVAPDDFARTSAGGSDFMKSERSVVARFTIYYQNGSTEEREQLIRVARPPLMLQHGINSDRFAFDAFKTGNGMLLKNSGMFKVVFANQLGAYDSFSDNANILIVGYGDQYSRSYRDLIQAMRQKGFACNRLDYVGHSMGGCMARRSTEFGAYRSQENYGRGYLNKLITLHTPHNGSPMADLIEVLTDGGYISNSIWVAKSIENLLAIGAITLIPDPLNAGYQVFLPNILKQIDHATDQFVASAITAFVHKNQATNQYKITDAARDLEEQNNPATDMDQHGYRLKKTLVNNHLLAGDISCEDVNAVIDPGGFTTAFWKLFNFLTFLSYPMGQVDICPSFQALMDKAGHDGDFAYHSDFIVGTQSQTAGQPYLSSSSTITVVHGVAHSGPFPRYATADAGEADKVFELLNSPLGGGKFAATIPETPLQGYAALPDERSEFEFSSAWDTSKVKIRKPLAGAHTYVDSLFEVQVEIKDNTGLAGLYLFFQGNIYFPNTSRQTQSLYLSAGPETGEQEILLVAYYQTGSGVLEVYDSVLIQVDVAAAIQAFVAEPSAAYLQVPAQIVLSYWAVYPGFIVPVEPGNTGIQVSDLDPSVVNYDPAGHRFVAVAPGETRAVIQYQGLRDTVFFHISAQDTVSTAVKGVGETPTPMSVFVYPNPSGGLFNVLVESDEESPLSVELHDCTGRLVYSTVESVGPAGTNRFVVGSGGLRPGIYFLRVRGKSGTIARKVMCGN